MYDLIIIGGGAASLAAAAYATGKQLNYVIVYTHLGGRAGRRAAVRAVQEYSTGHILVQFTLDEDETEEDLIGGAAVHQLEHQLQGHSGQALKDRVLAVRRVNDVLELDTQLHGVLRTATVLIATGVSPHRVEVAGMSELLIQNFGYSTTMHANTYEGKQVAVIGDTARALRWAAELAQTAARVYLVAPHALRPTNPLVGTLGKLLRVEVLEGFLPRDIVGDDNAQELVVAKDEQIRRLLVSATFADMGVAPNTSMVQGLVELDKDGFIVVDRRNATSVPGVFAAGDVTSAYGDQVLIAIGEGARAAISAHDYVLARALERQINS